MMEVIITCPPVVVPLRVKELIGLSKVTPVAGAIVGACDECGTSIWIGPKSQEAMKKACKVLCMMCVLPRIEPGGDNVLSLGGKGNTYHMKDGSIIE